MVCLRSVKFVRWDPDLFWPYPTKQNVRIRFFVRFNMFYCNPDIILSLVLKKLTEFNKKEECSGVVWKACVRQDVSESCLFLAGSRNSSDPTRSGSTTLAVSFTNTIFINVINNVYLSLFTPYIYTEPLYFFFLVSLLLIIRYIYFSLHKRHCIAVDEHTATLCNALLT